MSVAIDAQCYLCHLKRHIETARKLGDEETASAFARAMMQLYVDAPPETTSPEMVPYITALYQKFYGLPEDRYKEEKEEANAFVIARMENIRSHVRKAADPLYAALQCSILGNYLDFSALQGEVSFDKMEDMLSFSDSMELDAEIYAQLKADLEKGKRLLYLTDNAGEIGFDRIFAEEIHRAYPHLEITVCVRGGFAQNDATRADAQAVGMPFPVIDNGNNIPGTVLRLLSEESKKAMDEADVILSKGQANVETLLGCGYNIYYAFLVKCVKFQELFQKPKLTPMLVREKK